MKKPANDVGSNLVEQIKILIGQHQQVVMTRERPWASITFSGTRHTIEIIPTTGSRDAFAASLGDWLANHEFELPGHFVADVLVHAAEQKARSFTLEILTIDDPLA